MTDTPTINPQATVPPSLADWHAALAAIRQLDRAPEGREQVPLAALVRWQHQPLLVAAGCKTLAAPARAGRHRRAQRGPEPAR